MNVAKNKIKDSCFHCKFFVYKGQNAGCKLGTKARIRVLVYEKPYQHSQLLCLGWEQDK